MSGIWGLKENEEIAGGGAGLVRWRGLWGRGVQAVMTFWYGFGGGADGGGVRGEFVGAWFLIPWPRLFLG